MNRQRVDTPIVINPKDIEEGNATAVRMLNQQVTQLLDRIQSLERLVDNHDQVINGQEETADYA